MNFHQRRQVFQCRYKKWNKKIWIAKKVGTNDIDDYGYEIPVYEKPKMYEMNVQPISSEADIQEFGESARQMQKAVIEMNKYFGVFHEFDVAYLDGVTPKEEKSNGENANYRLYPPRYQNKCIVIYFERLIDK